MPPYFIYTCSYDSFPLKSNPLVLCISRFDEFSIS